jgi:hypothetical protein
MDGCLGGLEGFSDLEEGHLGGVSVTFKPSRKCAVTCIYVHNTSKMLLLTLSELKN